MKFSNFIDSWKNTLIFDETSKISKVILEKILEAARWAPSAENQQTWNFLAVTENKKKQHVIKAVEKEDPRLFIIQKNVDKPILKPSFLFSESNFDYNTDKFKDLISKSSHQSDLKCAQTCAAFIICAHLEKGLGITFGDTDIGAAIANMILICHDLGLGSRFIRNFDRGLIKESFKIPELMRIDIILAIGAQKQTTGVIEHKNKKISEFCFHNTWKNPLDPSNFFDKSQEIENNNIEIVDSILDRRSIRDYDEKRAVPKSIIKELLKSGFSFPLSINKPYIKLLLIDKPDILAEIAETSRIIVKQSHVAQVPLIIALAFDCNNNSPAFYAECDSGGIMQNILLRAHTLGIGSCWIGAFSRKTVRKTLKIENNWHLPTLAILGYPDKYPKPTPRLSLGKIAYLNEWENSFLPSKKSFLPNNHALSILFRKFKKTRIKTPLRKRKVGNVKGIPEFEQFFK